jgi:hypothetical protein
MRSSLAVSLLVLLASCAEAVPIDSVHKLMEPAAPMRRSLRLQKPPALRSAIGPASAVVLVPAALGGMAVACPDVLARLLVHMLCYIGSLFEPFDTVLPEKGLLRSLVTTVQQAKKAYNVKHGLVSIDEQQFFDSEDELESDAAEETHPNEADSASSASDGDDDGDEDEGSEDDE